MAINVNILTKITPRFFSTQYGKMTRSGLRMLNGQVAEDLKWPSWLTTKATPGPSGFQPQNFLYNKGEMPPVTSPVKSKTPEDSQWQREHNSFVVQMRLEELETYLDQVPKQPNATLKGTAYRLNSSSKPVYVSSDSTFQVNPKSGEINYTAYREKQNNTARTQMRKKAFYDFMASDKPNPTTNTHSTFAEWSLRQTSTVDQNGTSTGVTPMAFLNNLTPDERAARINEFSPKQFKKELKIALSEHNPSLILTETHGSGGMYSPLVLGPQDGTDITTVNDLFKGPLSAYSGKTVLSMACNDFWYGRFTNPVFATPLMHTSQGIMLKRPVQQYYTLEDIRESLPSLPAYIDVNRPEAKQYTDFLQQNSPVKVTDENWTLVNS